MRGHYYSDVDRSAIVSAEDRNQRENELKQAAGEGPTIYPSPETPSSAADVRAIIRHVAFVTLLNDLDYHGLSQLSGFYHVVLQGITEEQIRAIIAEELE